MRDRRIIYFGASCAAYLALWLAVPQIALARHPAALFVLTAAFMGVQLSITRWFASLTLKPRWAALVMAGAGVAWIAVVLVVTAPYLRYDAKEIGSIPVRMKKSPPPASMDIRVRMAAPGKPDKASTRTMTLKAVRRPANLNFKLLAFDTVAGRSRAASSLLIILAASAFGYLVSFILRDPNIVLPVAALSPYVDVWTVLIGPTSRAVEKSPHIVRSVSAAMPTPGSAGTPAGVEPISFVGPADFIFLAIFFGALYRLRMEPRRTFWLLFPLLTLGMAAVLAGQYVPSLHRFLAPGLPALVLIGFAVIVANFRHFKLKRHEYIAVGIVALLLGAALFLHTFIVSR